MPHERPHLVKDEFDRAGCVCSCPDCFAESRMCICGDGCQCGEH